MNTSKLSLAPSRLALAAGLGLAATSAPALADDAAREATASSAERIVTAAKAAGLEEDIAAMPMGMHTVFLRSLAGHDGESSLDG